MTAPDLAAICERHGITINVAPTINGGRHYQVVILDETGEQPMVVDGQQLWECPYDTPDEGITRVLKMRYGIRAIASALSGKWYAYKNAPQTVPFSAEYESELAAVVALAATEATDA